jgi:hypothetical protein
VQKGKADTLPSLHQWAMQQAACCFHLAAVNDIRPHHFKYDFGTSITRKGLDPLYGKELMGIRSDKVYGRYTQGGLNLAAESRLFAGDWGRWGRRLVLFVKQSACKS